MANHVNHRTGAVLRGASLAMCLCVAAGVASAEEIVRGPIVAEVVKVEDGGSFTARAHVWPGKDVKADIRVAGISTPSAKGGMCRPAGVAARNKLADLIGRRVILWDVAHDFGGRVRARVETMSGRDVAEELVRSGLARRGEGDRRWCPPPR